MYEFRTIYSVFVHVFARNRRNNIEQSFQTQYYIYAWRVLWAPNAHAHVQNMLLDLVLFSTQSRHLYSAIIFFPVSYLFTID